MEALDRLADLGIDGFRFDLAGVLARDPMFVRRIGDWAIARGVRVVAEPWDLAQYLLGRAFPDPRWMQWNDRFRDDMRGFLRGEPGLVAAVMRRLEGSPDLFDEPMRSVNFLTAHDGFTMYDLVAYEHKHNEANGWHNTDGTDHHRSWNGGWEGDDGVPELGDRHSAAPDAQRDVPAPAVARGADVRRRRRVRPYPARQQQPVQPGQRDVVDRLDPARRLPRPRGLRRPSRRVPRRPPDRVVRTGVVGRPGRMVRRVGSARHVGDRRARWRGTCRVCT